MSEIDTAYHDAALKLGMSDSAMLVLYTLCSCGGERRKKKVYLTENGRQLAKDTVLRVIKAENEIFASWSDEEKSIYIDLTQRYLADFKEKVKEL